jgi:RimJ/RimL family protein N-acetyltransferase
MQLIENLKPVFETYMTGTFAYRPISRSDAFPLYEAAQEPQFLSKLWWGPPDTYADAVVEVDKLLGEHTTNTSVVLSVVERTTGKWIGFVKFMEWEDTLMMTLWTHPDYWRSTTPFRCAETAVDIVIQNTNLPFIYARVTKDYPVMEKMVMSNGFIHEGESTGMHTNGTVMPCNVFKLTRENWTRTPKSSRY